MIIGFFMTWFSFWILSFPVFYHYFLILSSEIYRFTLTESFIEFYYVVSGDILLSTCYKMSFYHIRECLDENIKWLFIISSMSFFVWLDRILESMDNIGRIASILENERLISHELDYNIRYTEYRIYPRIRSDFHSFYLFERNNHKIRSKKFPLEINKRLFCEYPYICIPIKYLVNE